MPRWLALSKTPSESTVEYLTREMESTQFVEELVVIVKHWMMKQKMNQKEKETVVAVEAVEAVEQHSLHFREWLAGSVVLVSVCLLKF